MKKLKLEIKNLLQNGENSKKTKLFILVILSNFFFYFLTISLQSYENENLLNPPPIESTIKIQGQINIHPDYQGLISLIDVKSNKVYEEFALIKILDTMDENYSSVLINGPTQVLGDFWNKKFLVNPKSSKFKIKTRSKEKYDYSF